MTSIFTEKTYIDVEESELSEFVSKHYGRPWRLQQQDGCLAQNTYLIIDVDPEGLEYWTPEEAEQQIKDWLALPKPEGWQAVMHFQREEYITVEVALWDLCRRGIAPVGEYLIRVWW